MLSFMMNIKVEEDCEDKAIEALSKIDRKANTHAGCIDFMWFQHKEAPLQFTLLEQWENKELMDAHIDKIIDIWNEFEPCLAEEPDSTELDKLVKD